MTGLGHHPAAAEPTPAVARRSQVAAEAGEAPAVEASR